MIEQDSNTDRNKDWWEKMVKEECGFTHPWINLEKKEIQQYIENQQGTPHEQLGTMFPANILSNVDGKDVLCLASGGGQQSAVFSLLGARVTVVDITEGQLNGDRKAAEHYGYEITTMRADICALDFRHCGKE
jgi:2-polyprenyl-3-methyl-5-hydroxy-6-metoxy-1,4-benzoquinol methylase